MRTFVRMFKPQFAHFVKAGTKKQTVRPVPKVLPKPGDMLSLREWIGRPYRSKQREICKAVVSEVIGVLILSPMSIYLSKMHDPNVASRWQVLSTKEQCEFACADGFKGRGEMLDWFEKQHGLPFTGILIKWE